VTTSYQITQNKLILHQHIHQGAESVNNLERHIDVYIIVFRHIQIRIQKGTL